MTEARTNRLSRRSQDGSALVEATFVVPLFVLLVMAILEFGLAFHDKLTVGNIAQTGVRAASTQGNDLLADYNFVRALDRGAAAMDRDQIQYVVLYKATGPDSQVPSSCQRGVPQYGLCNVYRPQDFDAKKKDFGCKTNDLDKYWCPTSRKVATTVATGGPPDYLGVYVRTIHDNMTGFFGDSFTLTDDKVMRMEARRR